MQFGKLILAATAFAVASAAKIGNTAAQFNGVTVGTTFNITWYDASGSVSIILKNGPADLLKTVSTIASGLTGTSYAWSIPSTLPVDYYAFEIDDSTGINYSQRFLISGGPSLTSSVASSTTTNVVSSSSSSGSAASTTSASTTASGNSSSTTSTGTHTSTGTTSKTSTSSTSTATTGAVNSAAGIASPLAFVLLAFAAILTIN